MTIWPIFQLLTSVPETKTSAVLNSALKILFAPISLAFELASISTRLIDDELPSKSSKGTCKQTGDALRQRNGHKLSSRIPSRRPWLYRNRFRLCWEDSASVLLQSTLYFVLLEILAIFGLQHVFRLFRDDIEGFHARITGNWYVTKAGEKLALSPSSGDPVHFTCGHCFALSCSSCSQQNGQRGANADCPLRASFLSACCKVSYESAPIIRDVITERWKLQLTGFRNIPADIHLGREYAPDVVWFSAGNDSGTVIAFTGAQIWLKVDRETDIMTELVSVRGCGKMMAGFVKVLDRPDTSPGSLPGSTIYHSLEAIIAGSSPTAEVYLTGHSLGGATALVFAMLLKQRNPGLSDKVQGIFTFGAPRIGDADFAACAAIAYGGRLFRYVCGADMVSKLPHAVHGTRFHHHKGLRFISSDARVLREEDDNLLAQRLVKYEDKWAYALNLKKILRACLMRDFGAAVSRLVLFALPGFSDHYLTEYQDAIDRDVRKGGHSKS